MGEPAGKSPEIAVVGPASDPLSAMAPRFNFLFRWFARRFFRHFDLDDATVAGVRELERKGSVVYVMRYASRLDYFLFNTLFLREGISLSRFANGIRFYYYRPFWEALRTLFSRQGRKAASRERSREWVHRLANEGGSFFLFLRTDRLRRALLGRRRAVAENRNERDVLADVVSAVWDHDEPVSLVPLALFWRKGPRARRRFLNLTYGAPTRPSDLAKVVSFLTTYRGLFVKVGDPIDLREFVAQRREEGAASIERKVRRAILTFLYREEKVVEGPTLQPRHKVQEILLRESAVQAAIRSHAEERRIPIERARAEAEKMFREISAHQNSTFLAVLDIVVSAVMRRLFASIEVSGIEKVAEYAKRHPLVLVPSHRSYFDFLIISVLFYANHLVPPHIAARDNMAFGPFGFIWRRAGAFFLRRSFDDPLYKAVFRSYVTYLIREGFTQEFFIEGGRSRTGKMLPPRLGMLGWNVEAFLGSARRDLFFVPIAITYERLVEEGAMVGELEGEQKSEESMMALVRARKFLQRRFGSVFVNFGAPISLDSALGSRREAFSDIEGAEAERRVFVLGLGRQIVEHINWAVVPNATSVAACALLGERRRGFFREELATRMQDVLDLLRLQDVQLTPALAHDEGAFEESIASLVRMDLLREDSDPRGEILFFDESQRRALDIYRNAIVHFLAAPSFLSRELLADPTRERLRAALATWLDLFYQEFFTPRGEALAAHFDAFLDHFERHGFIESADSVLRVTEKGRPAFRFLSEQTQGFVEAYYATFVAAQAADVPIAAKALQKAAEEQFQRSQLLGEMKRPEAANAVTFANAIDWLVQRGALIPDPDADAKSARDRSYVHGPSIAELQPLCERLAGALRAR